MLPIKAAQKTSLREHDGQQVTQKLFLQEHESHNDAEKTDEYIMVRVYERKAGASRVSWSET